MSAAGVKREKREEGRRMRGRDGIEGEGQPRSSPHEGQWTNGTSGPLSLAPEARSSLETQAGDLHPRFPSPFPPPIPPPPCLTILSSLFPINFLFHTLCVILSVCLCQSARVSLLTLGLKFYSKHAISSSLSSKLYNSF